MTLLFCFDPVSRFVSLLSLSLSLQALFLIMGRPTARQRKLTVVRILHALTPSFNEATTKGVAKRVAPNPSTALAYFTQLEEHVYDRYFLLDGVDSYRHRLATLMYNLEHNGDYLYLAYTPLALSRLPEQGMCGNADMPTKMEGKTETKTETKRSAKKRQEEEHDESNEAAEPYLPITVTQLAEASKTFAPARSDEVVEELEKLKPLIAQAIGVGTGKQRQMFTCRHCPPGTQVEQTEMQTRSADEPMTIKAKCTRCQRKCYPA